jgi:hypothetical protein
MSYGKAAVGKAEGHLIAQLWLLEKRLNGPHMSHTLCISDELFARGVGVWAVPGQEPPAYGRRQYSSWWSQGHPGSARPRVTALLRGGAWAAR